VRSRVRVAGAVAAGLATLVLAGCAGPTVSGTPSPASGPTSAAIESVLPCTLLTQQELQQQGQPVQGAPYDTAGETGCSFHGQDFGLDLGKAKDGLNYFTKRAKQFVSLKENSVNGRSGVQIIISHTGRECTQVMAVGTGDVTVGISYNFGHQGDPCAKVMEIAQLIEPRLPK
jgi:Protein of unknown function (DUF3558)